MLPSYQKSQIYSLISNFNVVHTVLCQAEANARFFDGETSRNLATYLNWVLADSDVGAVFLLEASD